MMKKQSSYAYMHVFKNVLMVMLLLICIAACTTEFDSSDTASSQNSSSSSDDENPDDENVDDENVDDENVDDHETPEDYTYDSSDVIHIVLNGDSIAADSDKVTVDGSKVTLTTAATYSLSGTLDDGQVVVDTEDQDVVRLILNGVHITNTENAPIYIENAEKTVVILAEDTENYIEDAQNYAFDDAEEDEPNAALFSKDDLTITGDGALTVVGNYNDAIASKDGLIINGGTISLSAIDDGIRGKDYLVIKDGSIVANVNGDGLKSNNDGDAAKGYISIESGDIEITAGGDAITAETDVSISDGDLVLSSGGGSTHSISDSESAKGIKAGVSINVTGGTIDIDAADDAVHSNDSISIDAGTLTLSTGDDAIHADYDLTITGGVIDITKSYEGIESADGDILIQGGTLYIVSSDDGINVAGGGDGSGIFGGPGRPPGKDFPTSSDNRYLYIQGGYMAIDSDGDGIDVNGSIEMSDGDVIIHGPTSNGNGAIDYDASFQMTGGFLLAAGSAGMAQFPDTTSSQCSLVVTFSSTRSAGSLIHLQTDAGSDLFTFAPIKSYQSVVFSSPDLIQGSTYNLYLGGSSTGTPYDGLYQGGTYTPGTQAATFSVTGTITRLR